MSNEKIKVEKGSGNVYKDLGLPNPKEEFMKVRFVSIIRDVLVERGLGQDEAADILDISRSEVAALLADRSSDFSLNCLILLLGKLDLYIEFIAHEIPPGTSPKGLRVSTSF